MTTKFWIGAQGDSELQPEHLGRTVMIEHFRDVGTSPTGTTLYLKVHVGTLVGFTEERGRAAYGLDDIGYQGDGRAEYPDLSMHADLSVIVVLDHGISFRIAEKDFASVWLVPATTTSEPSGKD